MTEGRRLIGIAGPSCSGKTTVARAVLEYLGAAVLVQADRYYYDLSHLPAAERTRRNFDHPDAIDHHLLARHLTLLLQGRTVSSPTYDFATHTRGDQVVRIASRPYIVAEGLWLLYWPHVRELLDLSIMLTADHITCLHRRLRRDSLDRARDPEYVRLQYERDVRPMCDRYLLPSARHADVEIDGTAPIDEAIAESRRALRNHLLA